MHAFLVRLKEKNYKLKIKKIITRKISCVVRKSINIKEEKSPRSAFVSSP